MAINASYFGSGATLSGKKIHDGVIISDTATSFYTLGIKPGNTFAIYNSSYSAQDILNDGCINSFAGFIPLVENGSSVRQSVKDLYSAGSEKHSRQVIAQYSNKDILILTVDGR